MHALIGKCNNCADYSALLKEVKLHWVKLPGLLTILQHGQSSLISVLYSYLGCEHNWQNIHYSCRWLMFRKWQWATYAVKMFPQQRTLVGILVHCWHEYHDTEQTFVCVLSGQITLYPSTFKSSTHATGDAKREVPEKNIVSQHYSVTVRLA